MELKRGRPEILNKDQIQIFDFLDSLNISYEYIEHEPADTMEICGEIEKSLQATICKNLFLTNTQHTKFYLLLMPGNKRFKTKELSKQINSSRLSFGNGEEMNQMIHCLPGSASILGLIFDQDKEVNLLIDEDIFKDTYLGCHPCLNTSSIRMPISEVIEKLIPALKHDYITVHLIGE